MLKVTLRSKSRFILVALVPNRILYDAHDADALPLRHLYAPGRLRRAVALYGYTG
jgi:hypothetical protein